MINIFNKWKWLILFHLYMVQVYMYYNNSLRIIIPTGHFASVLKMVPTKSARKF